MEFDNIIWKVFVRLNQYFAEMMLLIETMPIFNNLKYFT